MCKYLHIILEIITIFAIRIRSFWKKSHSFSLHLQIDQQNNRSATNEGSQLIPYWGVSIGGIRQKSAGDGSH